MRAREMAAAVVGPGKKMTRRGWHISEGGEGRPGGPAGRWAGARERGGGLRLGRKAGWVGWPLGRLGRK
jgi:hypothetical protein